MDAEADLEQIQIKFIPLANEVTHKHTVLNSRPAVLKSELDCLYAAYERSLSTFI